MRRALSYGFVSAALALAGAWVVAQLDLTVFQPGEVISSQEMNENFQRLDSALDAKQARVAGTCAPGSSIRVVRADGTVDCEPDDTAAGGGGSSVATDATLRGDGRAAAPLGIEVPLELEGSSNARATLRAVNTSTGSAVRGEHGDGTTGYLGFEAYGVYGQHSGGNMGRLGSDDYGVYGANTVFDSNGYLGGDDTGTYGQNGFTNGRGVYGYASHPSGANHGVLGRTESTAGTGVRGIAAAESGEAYALYGETASPEGYAAWGRNDATGAFGYLAGGWGAYGAHGTGDTAGILGTERAGVEGLALRGALAGRFDGDVLVDGDLLVSGTIDPPSSRTKKEAFRPVDGEAVLDMLATVPMSTWRYVDDTTGARHMGPMAEAFHDAFDLGAHPDRIATIDADGVALVAIQGLYTMVQDRDARIAELERRLARLEAALGTDP